MLVVLMRRAKRLRRRLLALTDYDYDCDCDCDSGSGSDDDSDSGSDSDCDSADTLTRTKTRTNVRTNDIRPSSEPTPTCLAPDHDFELKLDLESRISELGPALSHRACPGLKGGRARRYRAIEGYRNSQRKGASA